MPGSLSGLHNLTQQGFAFFIEGHVFPGLGIVDNGLHKGQMELVSGTVGDHVPHHRGAEQGDIADDIEHLVADELIVEAQAVFVEDGAAVPMDGDHVVQRAAQGQAVLPKLFHLFDKTEGAGLGDFLAEPFRGHLHRIALFADQSVVELDAG